MNAHYGCGWDAPASWANFDASPTLRFERLPLVSRLYVKNESPFPGNVRFGDIVKGLPVEEGSCSLLYCSHVLEHLSLDDFSDALTNSYNILSPGGTWRLVVPDLRYEAERYLQSDESDAALAFMRATGLGEERRPRTWPRRFAQVLGNSRHRWLWDYPSISSHLESAGFVEIRRARLGDAEERAFKDVERPERWENALGVECRRPR